MNTILAIIGCISGLGTLVGVGIWIGTVNDLLKMVRQDREKFPPAVSWRMLSDLWEIYMIEPLQKRPDLAHYHSPCVLTPAGLDLISQDDKKTLNSLVGTAAKKEDLSTGYMIVQEFGLDRLNNMAAANKVSIQEMIAVLSTYVATCREKR